MEALVNSDEQPAVDDSKLDDKVEDVEASFAEVPRLWRTNRDWWQPIDASSEGSTESHNNGAQQYDGDLGAHASGAESVNVAIVGGALGFDCWEETGYCCDGNDQGWEKGDNSEGGLAVQLHVAIDAMKVR